MGNGGQENRLNSRFFQQVEGLPPRRIAASRPSLQYPKPPPTAAQSSGTRRRIPPTTGRKSVKGSSSCAFVRKRPENAVLWRYQGDVELPEIRKVGHERRGCLSALGVHGRRVRQIFITAPTPNRGQIAPSLKDCFCYRKQGREEPGNHRASLALPSRCVNDLTLDGFWQTTTSSLTAGKQTGLWLVLAGGEVRRGPQSCKSSRFAAFPNMTFSRTSSFLKGNLSVPSKAAAVPMNGYALAKTMRSSMKVLAACTHSR